jgi:transposase
MKGYALGRPSKYSPEFKREAIALAMSSGKSINQTARELGMSHETLRNWVKQHRIDHGHGEPGEPGELTSAEREELRRLRRQVADLHAERDILRRAAAYFAREMGR